MLALQSYPGDFPAGVKIAYKPVSQEIVVDVDLPLLDTVPELASCEYLPRKKEFRYHKLTVADRNKRYQVVIAQMTLRTLRCVFGADRGRLVTTVACNGYVDVINRATGQPLQPIIDYPWDDLPYADELDAAARLDSVKATLLQESRSTTIRETTRKVVSWV